MPQDYTPQLQQWMQQAGFSSFKALSRAAGISEKQILQFRRGNISQMRLHTLVKLSQALQLSLTELLTPLTDGVPHPATSHPQSSALSQELAALKQEYDRLQATMDQQKQGLWQEFQHSTLQSLESLLLQFPTAAYAAEHNPHAPAVKLLPLVLRPIEQLLHAWEITAIATVGSEIPYDPHQHQLMEGTAQPGDLVKVRYTGYRQKDKLLYRAKVSPVGTG